MNECTNTNSVEITVVKNSVDVCVFSVTSSYYLMTQFQPYRHDAKVGADE